MLEALVFGANFNSNTQMENERDYQCKPWKLLCCQEGIAFYM